MATQTTLTSQGLKDLEERLEHLKSVTRKEIAEKIKVALSVTYPRTRSTMKLKTNRVSLRPKSQRLKLLSKTQR